jgi:metallophosphoesterase (TIGR00282 family)
LLVLAFEIGEIAMKVLFIGDINGRPGRTVLEALLPALREEYKPHLVVANAENAAHGLGITPSIADQLLSMGVNILTGGNHLFDRKEILDYLPNQPRLLRAYNYPDLIAGHSSYQGELSGVSFSVVTFVGRTFMGNLDCPFRAFDRFVKSEGSHSRVRIIDFHAEATSEKTAFALYADGRSSAVIGTHTHVQTADERILPKGTAYITDVGMTGPHDGVIGVRADLIIQRFLTGLPVRFEPAEGDPILHAVLVDIDEATGKARSIERIQRTAG